MDDPRRAGPTTTVRRGMAAAIGAAVAAQGCVATLDGEIAGAAPHAVSSGYFVVAATDEGAFVDAHLSSSPHACERAAEVAQAQAEGVSAADPEDPDLAADLAARFEEIDRSLQPEEEWTYDFGIFVRDLDAALGFFDPDDGFHASYCHRAGPADWTALLEGTEADGTECWSTGLDAVGRAADGELEVRAFDPDGSFGARGHADLLDASLEPAGTLEFAFSVRRCGEAEAARAALDASWGGLFGSLSGGAGADQ